MSESNIPKSFLKDHTKIVALIAQLSVFIGFYHWIGFLIGPILIKIVCQNNHPELKEFFNELINFQITYILYYFIATLLCLVIIGVILLPVIYIVWVILMIIGLVKLADNNYNYKYPDIIRFI
ncbi:DUF4870 domain-containing protein [Lentisphaerota bacterium WC36G]|nr:DUF4870 domain-containing protein [Lentisphaerae bacterium WC36]